MFRLDVWAVTGMVPAPSGWPSLQRIAAGVQSVMHGMASPRRSPRSTPTAAAAPHPSRRQRGEHTSGSPIVEEPRLANMYYTACKAAATANAGHIESTQVEDTTHSEVPRLVTISFKDRGCLAVGMPFPLEVRTYRVGSNPTGTTF